jgi:predicted dehydrogenase
MQPHIDGWKAISDRAQIVAVADVSDEAMTRSEAKIGHGVRKYKDYHDLLADSSIDVVDVALPHHLHRAAIVDAANARKHIMSEKPFCLSLDEASDIAQAVQKNGVIFMAAHNQLFFPPVLHAKQMLMHGDLGKIYAIHSFDCSARRPSLGLDKSTWGKASAGGGMGWRSDPAKMGGGELIDTGYHPTYRLLFLAGRNPSEVTAMTGTYRQQMQTEDSAQVLLKFDDGMMGHILTSWAMNVPGARPLLFSIMGEAGQLWGEGDKLYYQPVGFQTPATIEYPGWSYGRTFTAEIEHFVTSIEQEFEPLHSVPEATETLRIILAAYASTENQSIERL